MIMSGSGDMKLYWSNKFLMRFTGEKVKVYFKWFKYSEYVKICGTVDYGICLHNSESKVDLPMKILDCFACEVPVLALYYSDTIKELVKERRNGLFFKDAKEL